MRKLFVLIVGLMLIGGLSVGVYSASVSPATAPTASIGVNTIAAIYIDHSTVNLGTLTSADYDAETNTWDSLEATGFNVHAYANATYTVDVEVNSAPGGLNGDLKIDVSQDDSWDNLISGGSASGKVNIFDSVAAGYRTATFDYKYVPANADTPGDYTTSLIYTVSTN